MHEMDIHPIYPKMNLSKRMQQAKVCHYLLRNAVIDTASSIPNTFFFMYCVLLVLSCFEYSILKQGCTGTNVNCHMSFY